MAYYIYREKFIFYALLPVSYYFAGLSFVTVVLDRFLLIWETKKVVNHLVRQVVILYSNVCMRICLGTLSISHLMEVVT